jgi:hypothetical protein
MSSACAVGRMPSHTDLIAKPQSLSLGSGWSAVQPIQPIRAVMVSLDSNAVGFYTGK